MGLSNEYTNKSRFFSLRKMDAPDRDRAEDRPATHASISATWRGFGRMKTSKIEIFSQEKSY
jgi:hypothetical protein